MLSENDKQDGRRGARAMYYVLSGIKLVKGEPALVTEKFQVADKDAKETVEKDFKAKHKLTAASIVSAEGPFYEVKQGTSTPQARISVAVPAKFIDYTGDRWEGVYQGWKVIGQGLKGFKQQNAEHKDNENVFLLFEEAVKEKNPKPRFGGAPPIVPRTALESPNKL